MDSLAAAAEAGSCSQAGTMYVYSGLFFETLGTTAG
jgi:hypothetical protein